MDISHLSDLELIGLAKRCLDRLPATGNTERTLLHLSKVLDDVFGGTMEEHCTGQPVRMARPPFFSKTSRG